MSEQVRNFHISDVLSIITGRLVSTRVMEGYCDILRFMTGKPLFDHQLLRATDVCAAALLRQHPFLADIDASEVNKDNWREWLAQQIELHGETLAVFPLGDDEYHSMNAMVELAMMTPDHHEIHVLPLSETKPIEE